MATTTRDYYEILGIGRAATAAEIKSAYRKLAQLHHPDKNPGDPGAEEMFKQAAEAYAVLSDDEKRARYDRFGNSPGGGFDPGGFDPSTFADFSDILGNLFGFGDPFGGRTRGPVAVPGADLRYDLEITFEEAAFGVTKKLEFPRLEKCERCGGNGSEPGTKPETCRTCRGRGQVQFSQGFFVLSRPCPQCRGAGRTIPHPCRDCRGQGRVERPHDLEVRIPAGVDSGARLRISGEGEAGREGGPVGDLYVVLSVHPHERFGRDGANVVAPVEIGYAQAVLGASIEVPTLHGPETLEVPAGTAHGSRFRIKGKGIPRLGAKGKGDHVVEIALRVPAGGDLSEEHRALLTRLAELDREIVHEEKSVLGRVRDLFG